MKRGLSRRELLAAGAAGLLVGGCGSRDRRHRPEPTLLDREGVAVMDAGAKPIYLAREDRPDLHAHLVADHLFWSDIMMEHARFFIMLMPGADLADFRARADRFRLAFLENFNRVRTHHLSESQWVEFNRSARDLVLAFIEFKRGLRDAQASGKVYTLAWPLFYEHCAREAEYYVRRIDTLSTGSVVHERAGVVSFWLPDMAEHADFIAHYCDPREVVWINKALESASTLRGTPADSTAEVVGPLLQQIIDFKVAAEKEIRAGQLRTMMHPALAGHMRREALRFADELRRSS